MKRNSRTPSLESLINLTEGDVEKAKLMKRLLMAYGSVQVEEIVRESCPRTAKWAYQDCYHEPNANEVRMNALDEVLGTFGVERIEGRGRTPDIYYLNTGDSYKQTILYRTESGCYSVGNWGDIVERGNYI